MNKYNEWVCTDEDTNQWGMQTGFTTFRFKEDFVVAGEHYPPKKMTIDLSEYTPEEIESCINSYGYTLEDRSDLKLESIWNECGSNALWIIAECLFEQEEY